MVGCWVGMGMAGEWYLQKQNKEATIVKRSGKFDSAWYVGGGFRKSCCVTKVGSPAFPVASDGSDFVEFHYPSLRKGRSCRK